MITGTNHFVSVKAAQRYYEPYGYCDCEASVARKIEDHEIVIGPPTLKQGEVLVLLDDGTRYGIDKVIK